MVRVVRRRAGRAWAGFPAWDLAEVLERVLGLAWAQVTVVRLAGRWLMWKVADGPRAGWARRSVVRVAVRAAQARQGTGLPGWGPERVHLARRLLLGVGQVGAA